MRALAHWGEGRLASLPDVPRLRELGVPIEFAQWTGLFVPADTPEPVVARLREAARVAGTDPKVREVLLKAGSPGSVPGYARLPEVRRRRRTRMVDVVKRIGKVE